MADHLVRILTGDGSLRASAALTTTAVDEICRRQGTDPTASVALGRLASGATLLASLLKGHERLALQIEGNGPLQRLQAEADGSGMLRASVRIPVCNLPPRDGRFDVAGAVGRAGFLHVVRDLGMKEPYRGMVQLVSSEIAEDLAWYLTTSEQIPSSIALGVTLDPHGAVAAAGGVLVQVLPGADPARIDELAERMRTLPPVSGLLRDGLDPAGVLAQLFAGIPYAEQLRYPLQFRCFCSRRQALQLLNSLGDEELLRRRQAQEETSVTCEYCKEVYRFPAAELPGSGGSGAG